MKTKIRGHYGRKYSRLRIMLLTAITVVTQMSVSQVHAAVTITSISSAPSTTGSSGRLVTRIGDGIQTSTTEGDLIGATTSTAQYEWRVNQGIGAQTTTTAVSLLLASSSMSAGFNGANGVQTLAAVNYTVDLGAINTLYIFLSSSAPDGNTMAAESITLQQTGLGTQSLGDVSVSEPNPSSGGIKVEFTGGTGTIQLQFNQVFSRTDGSAPGFGNEQTLSVYAFHNSNIPEPSGLALTLLGLSIVAFRRRRYSQTT